MGFVPRPERTVPGVDRFDFVPFGGGSRFMQCTACRAVYSNGLDQCPRCHTPAASPLADSLKSTTQSTQKATQKEPILMVNEDVGCDTPPNKATGIPSTLIEFPGAGRAARPLWRKELSERVREIQERRFREAAQEAHHQELQRKEHQAEEATGTPLGLVPRPDQPALNPLVAAALKRIERAQQAPTRTRTGTRGASVAVAHVAEDQLEVASEVDTRPLLVAVKDPQQEMAPSERQADVQRHRTLSVVQPKLAMERSGAVAKISPSETMFPPNAGESFDGQDMGTLAPGEFYDDYAPLFSRIVAGVIDLFVVAFASSPFAAIIELTNGDWTDERVVASMGGILIIVMFLYITTSISLGGRTWGMSLLSLRAVDVDSGLPPTTKQSVTRAFAYMLSLATLGLGLLYALVDAEGRGVHDHLSGTTVVRE